MIVSGIAIDIYYRGEVYVNFRTGAQFSFSQLCGQVYPLYLAKIYSTAAGEVGTLKSWDKIVGFTLAAFVLGLGKVIFFDVTMFIAARILPQVRTLVIRDSFDYVNRHSIAYFTQEMSGNISTEHLA